MAFKKFIHYRNSDNNTLTLRSNGTLFIKYAILNRYGGTNCNAVEIYVDKDNWKIGINLLNIKDTDTKAKGTRRLSVEKSGKHFNISKVLKYFCITHQSNIKNILIHDESSESENIIVIDVKQLVNKKK